ncbi:hypothetical protein BDY17DRAFT_291840 [Neohortaea acidophila]|uniref:Domain of unknown function at the cortex 1 domain-containing protein n=1 Tax=Neohortaea acidophila TaxID=245834 RepID=A0A6A6Q5F8_9PEZI|nr:uncharacterized protein BDY17DRAFT_291840 [Neohortaea acidophila]KAF2486647.1 hypothetical protein BDY17DRAFT_291840 [Neohortaea acidophila]
MADKYILKVTAGPDYSDQTPIPINTAETSHISSSHLTANLQIRIQNYRGLPAGSPQTSPYFSKHPHEHDLYSLEFSFTPKEDINGHDLVFGNDFDHPIRDKLPPGFQQAFNLVKWFIDPGLYGDVHADEPYLYGPLLSSINTFRIGPKDDQEQERTEEVRANAAEGDSVEEGGDGDGLHVREELGIPADAAARKKHFLTEAHQKAFTFEKGREYRNDFFNPYLDFNEFSLKLPGWGMIPGITLPIINYWDGQPLRSHSLRYVLKNRATNDPLFVIVFTLLPADGKEDGEGEQHASANDNDDVD